MQVSTMYLVDEKDKLNILCSVQEAQVVETAPTVILSNSGIKVTVGSALALVKRTRGRGYVHELEGVVTGRKM